MDKQPEKLKPERADREPDQPATADRSRREFVALSAAIGFAAAARSVPATPSAVLDADVTVKTPDGTCDAAFFYPAQGSHPGVLIWTDIFGLRPVFRDFGRRLAAAGYAVLVPNPYYRSAKAPVFPDPSSFNFQSAADRAKLAPLTGPLNAAGAVEADAAAYVAFLDAQPQVNTTKKIGTQGYCMGGPLALKTAAVASDRVGAGASFHGGGLVTDKPDSPHLLAAKIKAHMFFAIAASDDASQPDAKDKLREAFAAAKVPAEIEVYAGTQHGWCVPDMPHHGDQLVYSEPDAERAWRKLTVLYRTALA
jgi:carboxymethylenebutenolidase